MIYSHAFFFPVSTFFFSQQPRAHDFEHFDLTYASSHLIFATLL